MPHIEIGEVLGLSLAAIEASSPPRRDAELGRALLRTARDSLGHALGQPCALNGDAYAHPALDALGATFVTLTRHGELRGCVGTLEAHRPLKVDVAKNVIAAAFHDPRFTPLAVSEFHWTRIEVSLLSKPAPLYFASEHDLLQRLRPGVDGVVLEWRGRRATFLPQVWDTLADPREFMRALKKKAGVDEDFWHSGVRVSRYAVDKWKETESSAS